MKKIITLFIILSMFINVNTTYAAQINSWKFKTDVNENGEADVGDEFCVADECFNVVSNDGKNVVLLAKYNLNVGNVCADWNSCAPIENPTGIQDVNSKGWFYDKENRRDLFPRVGVTAFSSTYYWLGDGAIYKEPYGSGRDTIEPVFDENSYLYEHVQNYKTYLKKNGAEFSNIRLLRFHEFYNVSECETKEYAIVSCTDFPDWLKSTSFWLEDALPPKNTGGKKVVSLKCNGSTPIFYADYYDTDNQLGVRPALEVELDKLIPPIVTEEKTEPIVAEEKTEPIVTKDTKEKTKPVKNPKTGVSNYAIAGILVCMICAVCLISIRRKSFFRYKD